jgi:hypothetical protein
MSRNTLIGAAVVAVLAIGYYWYSTNIGSAPTPTETPTTTQPKTQ